MRDDVLRPRGGAAELVVDVVEQPDVHRLRGEVYLHVAALGRHYGGLRNDPAVDLGDEAILL
jgi:hypothetical protein